MKISELVERLQQMKADLGDVPVMMLDDESGEYEDVAAAVAYDTKGVTRVDLCTDGQINFEPRGW